MVGYSSVFIVLLFIFKALTLGKDQLPSVDGLPHCFLPLHFWMDKGKVSTTATMHPGLLQAAFLPQEIQDGSGNGGGCLITYMPKVSMFLFRALTFVTCKWNYLGHGSK